LYKEKLKTRLTRKKERIEAEKRRGTRKKTCRLVRGLGVCARRGKKVAGRSGGGACVYIKFVVTPFVSARSTEVSSPLKKKKKKIASTQELSTELNPSNPPVRPFFEFY
jgi:hypothetical protein